MGGAAASSAGEETARHERRPEGIRGMPAASFQPGEQSQEGKWSRLCSPMHAANGGITLFLAEPEHIGREAIVNIGVNVGAVHPETAAARHDQRRDHLHPRAAVIAGDVHR